MLLFSGEVNPDIPLIAMVGRLSNQKGLDLVDCVLGDIMNENVQLVVLGMGEARYTNLFSWAEQQYRGKMAARESIEDIKQAMLAKDKVALDALRGIKKEFLEAKTAKGADGELPDERALQILQKMVKQRKEAAEMFRAANRPELAEDEMAQCAVIERYLPAMMSEEELKVVLAEIIAQVGATGPQDMGKVMGVATKQLAGKAEGKTINMVVRQLLTQG